MGMSMIINENFMKNIFYYPLQAEFLVCEIKFSRDILSTSIIDEVQKKIARLTLPKNMSCLPVLIHMGGVSERVIEQRYFAKIIDFAELINGMF
jgi:hypothetical protein